MPRHLISDAHEWINEIPTVPIYYLAKPQPRERAWQNQRGKKTLNSMGLIVKASRVTISLWAVAGKITWNGEAYQTFLSHGDPVASPFLMSRCNAR
jgi:hypothetical protein